MSSNRYTGRSFLFLLYCFEVLKSWNQMKSLFNLLFIVHNITWSFLLQNDANHRVMFWEHSPSTHHHQWSEYWPLMITRELSTREAIKCHSHTNTHISTPFPLILNGLICFGYTWVKYNSVSTIWDHHHHQNTGWQKNHHHRTISDQ